LSEEYATKGRLRGSGADIQRYSAILDKDNFQEDEPHWRRISKNCISLFQVLIDQDLKDLVAILQHYPRYTQWVCEHFRYAYGYSDNEADTDAASALLYLGEPYFSKQFVRNVVRKLPKLENPDLDELIQIIHNLSISHQQWHPIIVNYYLDLISKNIEILELHPLQKITITQPIRSIRHQQTFLYAADDRDAVLDIPYMT
jgi:hypothetical protein